MTDWVDERKLQMMKQFYYLISFAHEIGDAKGISYENLVFYTIDELFELLKNDKKLSSDELKIRGKGIFTINAEGRKPRIFESEQAQELFKLAQHKPVTSSIKGNVACKGKNPIVTGKVKIIRDPEKDTLEIGEILVTSMTRPEFVPFMKNASAIITDEGGISCHAAIIARELNKTCIIGTKVATNTLKNGDMVEVDANKGIVTKINN